MAANEQRGAAINNFAFGEVTEQSTSAPVRQISPRSRG
jgi:hypothetical protein